MEGRVAVTEGLMTGGPNRTMDDMKRWIAMGVGLVSIVAAGLCFVLLDDQWIGISVLGIAAASATVGAMLSGNRQSMESVGAAMRFSEDEDVRRVVLAARAEGGDHEAFVVLLDHYPQLRKNDAIEIVRNL